MRTIVLVHPPLLGPASLRPLAAVLAAAGHRVVLPDLRAAIRPPEGWWDRAAAACVAAAGGERGVLVAGHSGAGVLLPQVADRLAASSVVFVDAIVPAESGATEASDGLRSFVATLPVEDGLLPPWTRWWGEALLAELVPDPALRELLASDVPRLTPEFWAEPVPVPPGWPADRARYVRLSEAYEKDAEEAARRGWPVRTLAGTHLDPLVRPAEVAAALLEVAGATS